MGVVIEALELDGFDRLPLHTRRCVFWEVDPESASDTLDDALLGSLGGFESEFDKEAWISGLLLEWGNCCQMAVEKTTGRVVGSAFYAPPGRVPRARRFPTAPVSADAVLLTKVATEPGFADAAPLLFDAVIADVIGRGVRALEAFGRSAADSALAGDLTALLLGGGVPGNVCDDCLMPTTFLEDAGFVVIADDQYLPRLRLELDEGLGWKRQVERALEKLVISESVALQST
ncbi:hypothetical protein MYK68_20655 [Gordonia sp. PP30]|uniref:hypothetical protein n=1 Tax=unclassified Gordonia (in: high G+C Gram-positive bacteria) TaxID=2657482 RepID=UPI001FFFA716|nr:MULTISPECIES: hypothetical protein [unclassified Gordonia (in: high G+C Gram-positive bacteria)]UQE75067.1 hypothetical protein MYK68_20655 [Gordonia sp. PP30]